MLKNMWALNSTPEAASESRTAHKEIRMRMDHIISELWILVVKALFTGKFVALNACLKRQKPQINSRAIFYRTEEGAGEQAKLKDSRRKEKDEWKG